MTMYASLRQIKCLSYIILRSSQCKLRLNTFFLPIFCDPVYFKIKTFSGNHETLDTQK